MQHNVGYFGIICPKMDFYQGYFIPEDMREGAEKLRSVAQSLAASTGTEEKAVYLGGIVEAALLGSMGVAAATALLLTETDGPYFVVVADRQAQGTYSVIQTLKATSVDEARAEIEAMPEVMEIKQRLLDSAHEGRVTFQ